MGWSKTENPSKKKYTIEQFLNTKKYLNGAFNYNEEKIFFSSNESGIFNIYSIPVGGGNETQLTHSTNHSFTVLCGFPGDDRLLFAGDDSGNELNHIFLRELDGSIRDLTPWTNAKSEFYSWSKDRLSFFFLSNKRDPKFMDLYEMDIETFQPKILYQNQDGLNFCAISPDKRYLALTKLITENSSECYLYDFSTNALQNIAPHQDEIQYQPVNFSTDSRYLYFLTDQDNEFTYLKRFAIDSQITEIIEKHPWDIFFCSFSYTGKYRVTGVNEDGKTSIYIHNQETNEKMFLPKMPEGEITHVGISKSEKSMLFYVNGYRSPDNLYYYHFETSSVNKLTNSLSPEIDPEDLVDAQIIRYQSYDGTLIPALYYKTKDMQTEEKGPALILVHGGPGGQSRIGYSYLIQYLVNHGYSILSVNHRGSSGYGKSFFKSADHKHGEADLDDCIWAKHFLVGTGNIDQNKIGIIGGSYGGYIALAALTFRPDEMAVGVDICGISNWIRTLKGIPTWWEARREAIYKKMGNPETEVDYLNNISPLFHAENIKKPLLVIQGANDPRVVKIESDQIIEAVNKNGTPNQYLVFEDEGHGFLKKQNQMKAASVILEFLNEHLK